MVFSASISTHLAIRRVRIFGKKWPYLIGTKVALSRGTSRDWTFLAPVPEAFGSIKVSKPFSTGCLTPIESCCCSTRPSSLHSELALGTFRRAIEAARTTKNKKFRVVS